MLSKDEEMRERIDTMRQDADLRRQQQQQQQQASTNLDHAKAQALDTAGGRYGAAMGAPNVIGATAVPQYQKASAPFQRDPVPTEPPLGFSVNDLESSVAPPAEDTGPTSDGNAPSSVIPSDDAQRPAGVGPLSNEQAGGE